MNHSKNFVLREERKNIVFYSISNAINEDSILEAIQACGEVDSYFWCAENHLILIKDGFVIATLHSIQQSSRAIISLYNKVVDNKPP